MTELNMPGSTFEINIKTKTDSESSIFHNQEKVVFGPKGYDNIEFFLCAIPC